MLKDKFRIWQYPLYTFLFQKPPPTLYMQNYTGISTPVRVTCRVERQHLEL